MNANIHKARNWVILSLLFLGRAGYGQSNIDTLRLIGKYEGVICFKNECLIQKLQLKSNHKFKLRHRSNNGRKGKGTKRGTWILDKDILVLKTHAAKYTKARIEKYKVINEDLWYFSEGKLDLGEIAMKRK